MAHKAREQRTGSAQGRPRRWPWLLLVGVIVVLVGTFVFKVAGGQPDTSASSTSVGVSVPTFSLPSTTGHPISLDDYKGKKLVVYFYEGAT